ncbi:unnamed protein product [Paramecium sonneborni]|uniref:Uncharacterized protein n=1 Tax=Paramecium sonneborni TaxID=65129 RepID=A0A8S1Q341_9CILI|nr:unnamed protein product [Paramecium sonneborni]
MIQSKQSKQKFNIEDCSESEQEETQRKSLNAQSQSLFQTSLFSALDSQAKQIKKKPIVKKSMTEFLNNYDQNFDDVFGSMNIPMDINENHQESKKNQHNNNNKDNNNNNGQKSNKKQQKKRPIESVNSELDSNSNSDFETTIKKQSTKSNRNGKRKQSKRIVDSEQSDEYKDMEQVQQMQQIENKIKKQSQQKKQTKLNNKQSSEEQSSENKKYNPNSLDLPQDSKKDKKGQKLKTAIFNFGEEETQTKKQTKQIKKINKDQKQDTDKKQNPKTKNKREIEQDDDDDSDKIEQLIKEYQKQEQELQNNLIIKKGKQQKENVPRQQKVESKDKNIVFNKDSIKMNSMIPKSNKDDDEDNIKDK